MGKIRYNSDALMENITKCDINIRSIEEKRAKSNELFDLEVESLKRQKGELTILLREVLNESQDSFRLKEGL